MSKGTYVMERSSVIASIIKVKQLYLKKNFATFREINFLQSELQRKFNEMKLNICITDEINDKYFTIIDDFVIANSDMTTIEVIYKGCCPSVEVNNILWDHHFMYVNILKANATKDSLNFNVKSLNEIVEKILDNSLDFYSKVAKELCKEEYEFCKALVEEKSCSNCKIGKCEIGECQGNCSNWDNHELVGKVKVSFSNY